MKKNKIQQLTEPLVKKVIETVDAGLVGGLGSPKPGHMCVEAAVCFAYGLPHSDTPPCVGSSVRSEKIALNDGPWSGVEARTRGLRYVAVAQLGSNELNQAVFLQKLAKRVLSEFVIPLIAEGGLKRESRNELAWLTKRLVQNLHMPLADWKKCEHLYIETDDILKGLSSAAKDNYLEQYAECILDVLREMKSPGCKYLYLLD